MPVPPLALLAASYLHSRTQGSGAAAAAAANPVWFLPAALAGLCLLLLTGFFLWTRERRLQTQRERLRKTYELGEETLGDPSAEAILKRIAASLPAILGIDRVRLYTHNRASGTLELVPGPLGDAVSVSLDPPAEGKRSGAATCFRIGKLVVVPDLSNSPFSLDGDGGQSPPKSLLFVPMLVAQNQVVGVMELGQNDRLRDFTGDEKELAKHLGNQIGVAIRLLDQRFVQEQLFRTEKLAAVGRLISGVVDELRIPLASITGLANQALEKDRNGPVGREMAAIASEARKASTMVARLVSFAGAGTAEAKAVQVAELLTGLLAFRGADWKASGIRVNNLIGGESLSVLASQGQLEQVFLNLLVHAEQSLAGAPEKTITVRTSVLARRLLVGISFTEPPELRRPEETAAVLGVTRSVVAAMSGEVRFVDKKDSDPCFEIELPILPAKERPALPAAPPAGTATDPARRYIALLIEPEEAAHRQIRELLMARGYRVVPQADADIGLELSQRMPFDVVFCSFHARGLNWVELSEKMYSRVGGFVLLSDGYDKELAADFEGDGRFVLAKPIQESELERALESIEAAPRSKPAGRNSAG